MSMNFLFSRAALSTKERARRQNAAAEAEASLRLEGLAMSAEAKAISEEWQRGEIEAEEMMDRLKALD